MTNYSERGKRRLCRTSGSSHLIDKPRVGVSARCSVLGARCVSGARGLTPPVIGQVFVLRGEVQRPKNNKQLPAEPKRRRTVMM